MAVAHDAAGAGLLPVQLSSSVQERDENIDLQKQFIAVLNDSSEDTWRRLLQYLSTLSSFQLSYYASLPETEHYLQRLLLLAECGGMNELNIRQQLHKVFPNIVELSRPTVTEVKPLGTTISAAGKATKRQRTRHHKKAVTFSETDVRTLYTYQTTQLPVTFRANMLHVDDLVLATERVAGESLAMERWTRHPAGLKLLPRRPHSSLGFHRACNRPTLHPLLMSDIVTSPQDLNSGSHVRTLKTGGKVDRMLQLKGSVRTGVTTIEEVMRAFAVGQLTSKDEVYLNYADSIPWDSYKLVVVSKRQSNPEHFVATGFGIFHVYPDGEIESQSLAEWSRDTSVYRIIRQLPVFRDYLVSKMIRNWKQNVRRIKFRRNLSALTKSGIRFHSPYLLAIRKVKSLCEDLLAIDTTTVTPVGGYKGSMFWRHVETDQAKLQHCLNRYFRYCQRVITECVATQQKTVLELENHRKHQPFVSDLPISIQKEQHNKLECDLEEGKRRVGQVNALVVLARMIMLSNLREFMSLASCRWMEVLVQKENDEDDDAEGEEENTSALLNADLQFSSNGDLMVSLNLTLLRKWLSSPVHNLGQLMKNSIDLLTKDCPNPATSDQTAKPSPSPTTMKEEEEEEARLESARARDKLDTVSFKKSPNARNDDVNIIELVTQPTVSELKNCEQQLRAKSRLHTVVELICSEITEFCSRHNWLCEVNRTVQHWKKNSCEQLSKMTAEEVETTVMSAFVQLDKLSRVPSHFLSTHRVLLISNEQMISSLRPQVHAILSQLMNECLNTVTNGSNRLIALTQQHLELLSCKRYDLEGFAEFAQTLHRIHQCREVEQPKLSYVTKTLQALISSGTGVSDGVKELVEEGVRLWEECGDRLKEAEEFVASQTPMKAQGLHKNITGCEEEISHLVAQVNKPPFTNPNELSSNMLFKLEQVNQKVQAVRSRLADLGKWNKAITEESYDQAVVSRCLSCLYARQEIWRYKQTFESVEREWLDTQFRKLDVEALGTRITGWLESADKLAETLPDGDPVLYSWQTQLTEYHNYLPLLMRLSSKSLKVSHWQTIFAGVEEVYHPIHHYTLRDLIIHHVLDYPDTLTEVCHKAEKEAQLRHSVARLQEGWETRQVSIQQSPLEWCQFAFPNTQDVTEGKSGEKITFVTSAGTLPCLPSTHLLTVTNTSELCGLAEEDLVQLQILLGSPYLGLLKGRADHWQSILRQLLEVLSLISTCQQKWMSLLEVFATLSSDVMASCGLSQLQEATASYQEVVDGINGDPRPLSLLQKRRGEKGSRELQGELLRQVLNDTMDILDAISQQMECVVEEAYTVYPRLRILTNTELLQTISSSFCPTSLQSTVRKLFPAVSNLVTVEVKRVSEVSIVPTRERGVQIVAVEDYSGEQLTLATPLHTQHKSSVEWLKALDKAMRYSLACQLSYSRVTIPLILQGDNEEDGMFASGVGTVHWFTESLSQAAQLALELHWSSVIHAACDEHDESLPQHSINHLKKSLENAIHHCAEILRCDQPQPHLISSSLSVTILTLKHKVDVLSSSGIDSVSLSLHPFYHTSTPLLSRQQSFSSLHSGHSSPLLAKPLVGSTKSLLSSRHDLTAKSSLFSFPTSCDLSCGPHTFSYGYEYRGGGGVGIVLTPPAERCLVSLLLASGEGSGGIIMDRPATTVTGNQTALDLAKLLGRAYHHVSCSVDTREVTVQNALLTSLQCGSVLIINHINNLPPYLLVKLQQWITTISTALAHIPPVMYPMIDSRRASSSRLSVSSSTSRVDWYSGAGLHLLGPTRELELMGRTVLVRDQFTCVAVLGEELPHAVRKAFRATDLLVPDTSLLSEALLLSHGFRDAQLMGKKLSSTLYRLTEMAGNHHLILLTVCVQVRRVVDQASSYHHSLSECAASIVASILELWAGVCGVDNVLEKLLSILIGHFGAGPVEEGKAAVLQREESWLVKGIESELEERGLIQSPALLDKAVQLHRALESHSCVVLAGMSGAGKTSCYRTLAAAYNSAQHRQWCVNVIIVMTAAYTMEELFGDVRTTTTKGMQWSPGILTRLLQDLACDTQHSAAVRHWVVLEGPMSSAVMDNLNKLLTTAGLHLPNGEILHLPNTCKVIIETSELSFLSPSSLTHCVVVHCPALLSHDDILEAWLQRAPTKHNMSSTGLGVLADIIKQVLPKLLDYTATYGNSLIESLQHEAVGSLVLTEGFLTLLSALLERNAPKPESSVVATSFSAGSSRLDSRLSTFSGRTSSYSLAPTEAEDIAPLYSVREREKESIVILPESRDEEDEAVSDDDLSESSDLHAHWMMTLRRQMGSTCFFALVWSFGAYLPSYQMIEHFSGFVRELISQHAVGVSIPLEGTVFDYWLDLQTYSFKLWQERCGKKNQVTVKGSYVVLPELERYSYIVDLYMSCGKNVLLVGDEGIGKTSFVQHCIKPRMPLTRVSLGLALPPNLLQASILEKQSQLKKKQTTFKVAAPQRLTFFLDDLHLASSHKSSSSVIELILQLSRHHSLSDYHRCFTHDLPNVQILSACSPTRGRQVTARVLRSLIPVPFFAMSDEILCQTLYHRFLPWLQHFPLSLILEETSKALAVACVTVFRSVSAKFHPLPSSPQLLFTLHDLTRVYQGLLLISTKSSDDGGLPTTLSQRRRGMRGKDMLSPVKKPRGTAKSRGGRSAALIPRRSSVPLTLPSHFSDAAKKQQRLLRSHKWSTETGLMISNIEDDTTEIYKSSLRSIARLWCHENTRVFADRLTESRDQVWFVKLLETCLKYCFCGTGFDAMAGKGGGRTGTSGGESGTATNRRARPGRQRMAVTQTTNGGDGGGGGGEALIAELVDSGIRVDVLRKLLAECKKLMEYEEIAVKGEDVSGLLFVQLPKQQEKLSNDDLPAEKSDEVAKDKMQKQKVYKEMGDGQVKEALVSLLKTEEGVLSELLIDREAVEHTVRLCRVLTISGGHSLLLGPACVGRKSLTKLAALMAGATVFTMNKAVVMDGRTLCCVLRDACCSAGVDQKHTVLIVDSTCVDNMGDWRDLVTVMSEGFSPNLFTASELLALSGKLQAGRIRKTAEGTQQAFASQVISRLHVVVTWDMSCPANSQLFNITPTSSNITVQCLREEQCRRMVFDALLTVTSHVDIYQPWAKTICSEVAFNYWQQHKHEVELSQTYSQLEALSMLAAHAHLTTAETITSNHHHHLDLVSPKSLAYCLRMTLAMAQYLTKKETRTAEQLHAVLGRLSELERASSKLEYELEEELKPFLRRAEQEASRHMEQITAAKRKYMGASQRCKEAEEIIKTETANVQQLKKLVNEKLDEVSPQYMSALQALSSVRRGDILEVVSYRVPPGPLQPIFNALCLLFDRPRTWEDCQQLMLSQNFFESLRFFDKDHVSQSKLKWLHKKLEGHRNISPCLVGQASRAVVPLLMWLVALLDYHKLKHEMAPDQQKLDLAEKTLAQANEEYVDMRKEMLVTKQALEETVKDHKEELKHVRSAESKVKLTESRLLIHKQLMSQLVPQKVKWEAMLEQSQQMLECVPVHALLTAAAATYLSPLPILTHHRLWKNWLDYCNGAVPVGSLLADHTTNQRQGTCLVIKKGFSVHQVLAEESELSLWEQNSVFPHTILREKTVLWRANQMFGRMQFCFVLDPHNQFKHIVDALQESGALPHKAEEYNPCWSNVEYIHASEPLPAQQANRLTVLTTNNGEEISSSLHQAIVSIPLFKEHDMPQQDYFAFLCHRGISSASDSPVFRTLQSMAVMNLEVEEEGMVTLLKHHILRQARYQLWVHQRALLADLAYHKLELQQCQEVILDKVLNADMLEERSNVKQHHLASVMKELNEREMSTLDQVKDTLSALAKIREDSKPYTLLAKHATLLLRVGGGIHLSFTLDEMKSHLSEGLRVLEGMRYHDSKSCLAALLLRIKQQLTLSVVDTISCSLPADKKLTMLLAIAVAGEVERGRLSKEEEKMLIGDVPCSMVRLLELMDTQEYPAWTSEQLFSCAHELECFSCFRQLTQSLQTRSASWQEYFFTTVLSLVHNTPLPVRLSLSRKLLLWKILRPDKFQEAVLDFVSLFLGSEVMAPSPIKLVPVSSSSSTTLCLYSGAEQSLCDMLKPVAGKVGVDLMQLSLVCDGEEKVKEALRAGCWVVLEHTECIGNGWQRSLQQIMESQQDSTRSQCHLWIPLPLETTIDPWLMRYSHNIVVLPSSSTTSSSVVHRVRPQCSGTREIEEVVRHLLALLSPTLLQEAMYSAESVNTTNWLHRILVDEMNMIHYALQSTTSSLTHLMSYLRGEEEYSVDKGDLLQQVVSNTLPTKWATLLALPTTGERQSLSVALKLVQSRVQFLTQALSSVDDVLYSPLNVAWFTRPSSLLTALVDSYSHHHHLTTEQVTITTTITNDECLSRQDFSVMFTNLHTNHDTTEDSARVALQLTASARKEKGKQETILCPVLLREEEGRTINTGLMVEVPATDSPAPVQHW